MNHRPFDQVGRLLPGDGSRRGMLRVGAAGAVASAVAAVRLALGGAEDAAAKKQKCKAKPVLSECTTNKQCCHCATNRICGRTAFGLQSSCCGTKGATCADTGECCVGFVCNTDTGVCEEDVT